MDRGGRSIEIHWLKALFFRNREGAFCRSVPACVAKEGEALFFYLKPCVVSLSLSTGRRRRRLKRLRQQCREKGETTPASNSLVAGGSRFSGDSDSPPLSLSSSGSQERPRMLYGERERERERWRQKKEGASPPFLSPTLYPPLFLKRGGRSKGRGKGSARAGP